MAAPCRPPPTIFPCATVVPPSPSLRRFSFSDRQPLCRNAFPAQAAGESQAKDYVLAMVPAMENPDGEISAEWLIDHALQVRAAMLYVTCWPSEARALYLNPTQHAGIDCTSVLFLLCPLSSYGSTV